jgi:hypothetical protein
VIALIGNRPALQVGRHQVHDYDTAWLDHALRRAAAAADRHDFPFLDEIRQGVEEYLESRCPLKLLPLGALYERMRRMLETIGCDTIAEKLEPLAPPVTLCLEHAARAAGNGFELAFFEHLRSEIEDLRSAGAEEVRFTRLRESILLLRKCETWDASCDELLSEVRAFIHRHHREDRSRPRRVSLRVEGERD